MSLKALNIHYQNEKVKTHISERLLISLIVYILTGKRNDTVKCCHVLHVAHKHELRKLTMATTLSQASGYFNLSIPFTRYLSQILDVAFLLPVSILYFVLGGRGWSYTMMDILQMHCSDIGPVHVAQVLYCVQFLSLHTQFKHCIYKKE